MRFLFIDQYLDSFTKQAEGPHVTHVPTPHANPHRPTKIVPKHKSLHSPVVNEFIKKNKGKFIVDNDHKKNLAKKYFLDHAKTELHMSEKESQNFAHESLKSLMKHESSARLTFGEKGFHSKMKTLKNISVGTSVLVGLAGLSKLILGMSFKSKDKDNNSLFEEVNSESQIPLKETASKALSKETNPEVKDEVEELLSHLEIPPQYMVNSPKDAVPVQRQLKVVEESLLKLQSLPVESPELKTQVNDALNTFKVTRKLQSL